MLDFTQGWVWFVAGFSATLVVVLLLVGTAVAARSAERRQQRGSRRPGPRS
jgi:hypothetical protein